MAPERSSPRALLRAACLARKSGELIVAGSEGEIRLYVRAGRVAWGASSVDALGFARRLRAKCGVSATRLHQVVAECRREGVSLGAGLVRQGLATPAQVRDAMRAQTAQVIAALELMQPARTLFSECARFDGYDAQLTFGLDELLCEERREIDSGHAGVLSRLSQVMRELPRCDWSEWCGPTGPEERLARTRGAGAPSALRSLLVEGAADVIAVQMGVNAVLGVSTTRPQHTLWAGLGRTSLGAACAVLLHAAGGSERAASHRSGSSVRAPRAIERDATQVAGTATDLMLRAPDVCGVCHLVGGRVASLIVRDRSDSQVRPAHLAQLATQLFSPDVRPAPDAGAGMRTAVVGQPDTWSLGAELSASTEESIWVVTERSATLGFGWACVTSMLKRLEAA